MQNSVVKRLSILILAFFTIAPSSNAAYSATQSVNNWLNEPITISFQKEPLSKVLKQISQQTGVSIAYEQELANEKVTGNYQNIKTADAITRLFRGKNISIQVNNAKKIIIVKTFGAKNFIWAGTLQTNEGNKHDTGSMTLADIEAMHTHQYKAYKERITDINEIIPGGKIPMTRGEIRTMHQQQNRAYEARLQNETEIVDSNEDGVDITRGQIRIMQEHQLKLYQNRISNDDEIIKGGKQVTRGNIRTMQKQQYATYKKNLANNDEVVEYSEDGKPITRGEIRSMLKKQNKTYNERQLDKTKIIE